MKRIINFQPPKNEDPKTAAEIYIRAMYGMNPEEYAQYILRTAGKRKEGADRRPQVNP